MDKSYRTYKKALNAYQNGNISKSIKLCDKSISENIKCTASLNLKGLLYYLMGDLNKARALWKLNFNMNKDSVSRKYLDDTGTDDNKIKKYHEAISLIKGLNINEAIILLEQCKESDFNHINVYNSLAKCYMRKGEFNRAYEYIRNVLKMDKKNQVAVKNKKELASYHIKIKK